MPIGSSSDLVASNQLKISITTITRGQAWRRQIRGLYHLIYPWIITDFTHTDDIDAWIQQVYAMHTHAGVYPGQSVTAVPGQMGQTGNTEGKALIEGNSAVGKVRSGLSDLATSTKEISQVNQQELT